MVESSRTVQLKFTEVWPAGIVICAGTANLLVLSLRRATTRLVMSVPEMLTAPAAGITPLPSFNWAGTTTKRLVLSLSDTRIGAEPLGQFVTAAVTITVSLPSMMPLSMIRMLNAAKVWPGGMKTEAGTLTLFVSDDVKPTETYASTGTLTATSPFPINTPSPSFAVGGIVTFSTAVSLS